MTRSDAELVVAQQVIQSLINYCERNKKKSLDMAELRATIATLELERMGNK